MQTRGEEAWIEINRQIDESDLRGLVERIQATPSPLDTVRWFDDWWTSDAPTDRQRRVMLLVVWGGTLNPNIHIEADTWITRFRRAGFVSDLPGQPEPVTDLIVFRGAPRGSERGISWTISAEIARDFAQRHTEYREQAGLVWRAEVDRRSVLALIYQRDELEVVLDPAGLRALTSL